MIDKRSDMMMIVLPTQKFQQKINDLSGYCLPSLIGKFAKFTSDVCKFILDDC